MTDTSIARRRLGRLLLFAAFAVGGGGCDLVTKTVAQDALRDVPGHTVSVVPPVLEFSLTYNTGTAFSFIGDLGDGGRTLMGGFALLLVAGLGAWSYYGPGTRLEAAALGTLAAGALGNGWDRMFRVTPGGETGVVDFIKVNYPWGGHWPIFNIADVMLFVGVALLLLNAWRTRERSLPPPPAPQ